MVAVFLGQFRNPLIYLLFGAAAFAHALGETSDAIVIFTVVVLNTVPFGIEQVIAIGLVGSLVLWVEELRKLIVRRGPAQASRTGPTGAQEMRASHVTIGQARTARTP